MKVLLMLAHYFKAEEKSIYGSTSAAQKDVRRKSLETVLSQWRAIAGSHRELDISQKAFVVHESRHLELDIVIMINEENHLLDRNLLSKYNAEVHRISTDNPRYLPFGAHKLIQRNVLESQYDWYVYSEDDLAPYDPYLIQKQVLFQKMFGPDRILQPNRYEINPAEKASKTYVDGSLREDLYKRLWAYVEDREINLRLTTELGEIEFARAKNPHSGIFMLNSDQAKHWVAQKHFLDMDCSFVSPLESAGSLSLLKTFSLFKTCGSSMPWFEIHHQDTKFSTMKLPTKIQ